jgi:DNA polymerase-3 subunit delta
LVENNTDALRRECFNLISFIKGQTADGEQTVARGQITASEVDKWLSHNREESAFTLFSRIAAGDLSRALESLSVMLAAKESAPGILAGLAWSFRKLGDYLSLQEAGNENNSFELKKIGLSFPKLKSDIQTAARRYDMEAVEACLALTAQYDILLRSPVVVMEKILMDRYVLALINASMHSCNL